VVELILTTTLLFILQIFLKIVKVLCIVPVDCSLTKNNKQEFLNKHSNISLYSIHLLCVTFYVVLALKIP